MSDLKKKMQPVNEMINEIDDFLKTLVDDVENTEHPEDSFLNSKKSISEIIVERSKNKK